MVSMSFIAAKIAAIGFNDHRSSRRPAGEELPSGSGGSNGRALGHSSGAFLLLEPPQISAASVVSNDGAMSDCGLALNDQFRIRTCFGLKRKCGFYVGGAALLAVKIAMGLALNNECERCKYFTVSPCWN